VIACLFGGGLRDVAVGGGLTDDFVRGGHLAQLQAKLSDAELEELPTLAKEKKSGGEVLRRSTSVGQEVLI
jgi:hypothetical protein